MTKLTIKVSKSFEEEVIKKAKEIIALGNSDGSLGITAYGPLRVYINIEPKKILHVFTEVNLSKTLSNTKIYVGVDE